MSLKLDKTPEVCVARIPALNEFTFNRVSFQLAAGSGNLILRPFQGFFTGLLLFIPKWADAGVYCSSLQIIDKQMQLVNP